MQHLSLALSRDAFTHTDAAMEWLGMGSQPRLHSCVQVWGTVSLLSAVESGNHRLSSCHWQLLPKPVDTTSDPLQPAQMWTMCAA